MCTSYESPSAGRFEAFSLFSAPTFDYPREVYKDYQAPIVRRSDSVYTTDPATFGIVPRAHIPEGVKVFDTMNCRVETAGSKRSFRPAWTRLQLCLIGAERFYEPNYESGKAIRWRIGLASGEPLAIAGLWRAWKEPDGNERLSFSMLTVNAEQHPLMNRFHRPGSEKRSVVIVPAAEHEAWLASKTTDEAMSFLRLYPAGEMAAEPYPLPPRKPKASGKDDARPPEAQASLLADG